MLDHGQLTLLMDIAGLSLFGMTAGGILRNMRSRKRTPIGGMEEPPAFDRLLPDQVQRQQHETCMELIFGFVENEKRRLGEFAEKMERFAVSSGGNCSEEIHNAFDRNTTGPEETNPYGEAERLIENDFATETISEMLGIPRGEIELISRISKMRKKRVADDESPGPEGENFPAFRLVSHAGREVTV